jgi:hypothetical protein
MMDVVDFASHVYKLLRRRENEIKDFLAAEEYKKLVGELRGLSYASSEIKTLLERHADYDEDTFSS